MEKFRHDADIAIVEFCKKVMKIILLPPFEALLHPAAKHIIAPMADLIPAPVKDFIGIHLRYSSQSRRSANLDQISCTGRPNWPKKWCARS